MQRTMSPVPAGHVPFFGNEPLIASIHAYWQSKRGSRRMPARRDIDMVEIERGVLPYLILHDVVRADARTRYRYRLVGTELVNAIGEDITNRFLDDVLIPGRRDDIGDWLDECVRTCAPLTLDMPLAFPARDFRFARRIVLPLSDDGKTPDMLLCCVSLG
jgi:hypothetical protein